MRALLTTLATCSAVVAVAVTSADAASKCAGAKLKSVAKDASCLIKLDAKEAKTGTSPDPAKLQKCRANRSATSMATGCRT